MYTDSSTFLKVSWIGFIKCLDDLGVFEFINIKTNNKLDFYYQQVPYS